MAENRREKDKRFFFSRGQLFLLGGSFTVTAVIVFLLGILVGKDIEARRSGRSDEPVAKYPVKPQSGPVETAPAASAPDELTYYDTSTKAPASDSPAEEKRQESKPAEKSKAETAAAKPQPANDPAVKAAPKKIETPASPSEARATMVADTAEEKSGPETWSVQVNAYPDERSAQQLVDRLKSKGYNATVTEARNKGKLWYRVRVGRYSSKEEAKKLEDTLRTKEDFAKAFATSR